MYVVRVWSSCGRNARGLSIQRHIQVWANKSLVSAPASGNPTQRKSCRTFRRLAKKEKNFTSFFVFQMKIEKEWKEEEEKSARQIYLYTSEERRCFLSRDSPSLLARPLMLSLAPFGPATERKGTRRRAKITPTSSKSEIGREGWTSSNKQTTFRLF